MEQLGNCSYKIRRRRKQKSLSVASVDAFGSEGEGWKETLRRSVITPEAGFLELLLEGKYSCEHWGDDREKSRRGEKVRRAERERRQYIR